MKHKLIIFRKQRDLTTVDMKIADLSQEEVKRIEKVVKALTVGSKKFSVAVFSLSKMTVPIISLQLLLLSRTLIWQ